MTEIGGQCGDHSTMTPHASCNTAHYIVRHYEHPVALLTHSSNFHYHPAADHITIHPTADQRALCFSWKTGSDWSTLSWLTNCTTMWQLTNYQWAITLCAPIIKEELGKRTLPITDRGTLGQCRYLSSQREKWCAPAAILRRNYFENYSKKKPFQEGSTNIQAGLHELRMRKVAPDSWEGLGKRESKQETFGSQCESKFKWK